MREYSVNPVPIQEEWKPGRFSPPGHFRKETIGDTSISHRHCGKPMKQVITHWKSDQGVREVGCNSWICQVCERREYRPDDFGL